MTSPLSTSKFGGTRIPPERVAELHPLKYNELVSIHKDGSLRYFANEKHLETLANRDVVAVVYNGVGGLTMPQVVVSDTFRFDSTFQKPLGSLRAVMARYVKRSFFTVSTYRASDATLKPVGYFKAVFAVELGLRAAL